VKRPATRATHRARHEAWLRLVRTPDQTWQNRGHFFRTAAECMRRILIDMPVATAVRHGGGSGAGFP